MAPTQTNGEKVNGVNGASHASPTTPINIGERLASKAKPKPSPLKLKPTTPDKKGVANAFERYGQLMHARVKPLPTQNGAAGTFYETKRWGKIRDDIFALRGAGTSEGAAMAQREAGIELTCTRLEDAQGGDYGQAQGRDPDRR
jgi:hypothetical protein